MSEYSAVRGRDEKILSEWGLKILVSTPGWIALRGGFTMLQRITLSFSSDVNYMSFINSWLPWIAVMFFVMGWLIAHGVEIASLQKQFSMARIILVLFLLSIFIVPWSLSNLPKNPVFQSLDNLFLPLVMSGYFFRFSVFRKATLELLTSVFSWKK